MYSQRPNLYIGFHGCDLDVKEALIHNPDKVKSSSEAYDWLGHGFYVWENNYKRALDWAKDKFKRGQVRNPSVVGVIYQLNHCFDLTDSEFIEILPSYYDLMKGDLATANKEIPSNRDHPKYQFHDKIMRELDCAVIEYMHAQIHESIHRETQNNGFSSLRYFDSVRGVFTEGGPIYDGAGIQTKNHIQVCIRNLNCIKAFFQPRKFSSLP